jgi:cellulose synthase/poly-beta-1,6-N-acetylglucosamine synthase-like glycosyltransferase
MTVPVDPGIAILVVARDESEVLGDTLRLLELGLTPADRLHAVADHCRDGTLGAIPDGRVRVHVRGPGDGPPGKGAAIAWWLDQTRAGADADLPVAIVDADSLPAPDFLDALRRRLGRGEPAIQVRIEPAIQADSAMARLAAYSEIVEQRVHDAWRARLGWPVRLRGTGMAFHRPVLEAVAGSLGSVAEDIELTLLLAAGGTPISLELESFVRDPKPPDSAGIVRQRARWLKGQVQVLRRQPRAVARLVRRGPPGWALLASAFARPKALLLPMEVAASASAALLWHLTGRGGWLAVCILAAVSVCVEAAALLWGLRYVRGRRRMLLTLLASPAFGVLWLRSVVLSLTSQEDWLRARSRGTSDPQQGSG